MVRVYNIWYSDGGKHTRIAVAIFCNFFFLIQSDTKLKPIHMIFSQWISIWINCNRLFAGISRLVGRRTKKKIQNHVGSKMISICWFTCFIFETITWHRNFYWQEWKKMMILFSTNFIFFFQIVIRKSLKQIPFLPDTAF